MSPRTKRNISRVLPYGLIWLSCNWVFMLVEVAVNGSFVSDEYTVISATPSVMLFASVTTFTVGILVGLVEVFFFRGRFKGYSFILKTIYKLVLYVVGALAIILFTFPIAVSLEYSIPIWHYEVLEAYGEFLLSLTFFSALLQMGFILFLCLVYAAISENLGHAVLMNFFTGKYHRPKEEERIFMFLDMKSSTTLAEKLGHVQYFKFLSAYYDAFSNAIIDHVGEVYQYIGDEIIISWPLEVGLHRSNCIRCFFAMEDALKMKQKEFIAAFGVFPEFKAALHFGKVVTGEIGALKREITFSGDVLNVTSRIQGLCVKFDADLLVSGGLWRFLDLGDEYHVRHLGERFLKGRSMPVTLHAVSRLEAFQKKERTLV